MLNLDTHILLYALADELTPKEKNLLANESWSISGIVLWEVFKLRQLGRITLEGPEVDLMLALSNIHIWPIDLQVFKAMEKLDFKNDPADEIIAATSLAFDVPLLTRDQRIRKSKVLPLA